MKILPTIGPATESTKNLKFIFKHCSMVRLNSSHNNLTWHKTIIKKIKKIDPLIDILVDIPGVKPRTNNKEEVHVKKGELITFGYNKKYTSSKFIDLTRELPKSNTLHKRYFSLDDGKILFKITKFNKDLLIGKAVNNCSIKPKKGLNIPGSIYNNHIQKKIYLEYLESFKDSKLNAIGLSFVQNKDLIIFLKNKFPEILMVSKIENSEGLKNSDGICKYSDAIMIDRGDLSAEIGDHNLYEAILKISKDTKKYGKPLIMATENLETMSKNNSPSKNDIISLGFSTQVNSDIIMLSEETAISKRWKKIIIWLTKFLKPTKNIFSKKINENIFWETVDTIKDYALVVFTKKGFMLDKIFKKNVKNDVFIFTDTLKTKSISNFYKNAQCFMTKKFNNQNINKFYYENIKRYKGIIFKKANKVFLITISFPKKGSLANTLALINKKDI